MAQQQVRATGTLDKVDPVWAHIRREAEEVAQAVPLDVQAVPSLASSRGRRRFTRHCSA